MNEIININGIDCYEKDGVAYLRLETVARGLGFTRIANSGNEVVRWERVNKYLSEIGFVPTSGHDGFIPENVFYRLAMKAKNKTAEAFQAKVTKSVALLTGNAKPSSDTNNQMGSGLINVHYNNDQITVSARELHEFLEVETPYHKWFPRMCGYGFTESQDFSVMDIFCPQPCRRSAKYERCSTHHRYGKRNLYDPAQ